MSYEPAVRPVWHLALTMIVASAAVSHAAYLCTIRGRDGTFNGLVRIRERCRPREVTLSVFGLDPVILGQPPPSSSTTTTSTATTVLPPTETTSTIMPSCGNGMVDPGEVCDSGSIYRYPNPFSNVPWDSGGCPLTADGRAQQCDDRCMECYPAPRCGDRHYDPGDECDYGWGNLSDNCFAPGWCLGFDGTRCFCVGGTTTSTIP